jgi:hypothetical protein
MHQRTSHRVLPARLVLAALALAGATALIAIPYVASAVTDPAAVGPNPFAVTAHGGEVPGLTGEAAQRSVGAAADNFRQVTLARVQKTTAQAAAAATLHTDWGINQPQSTSVGLKVNQSVLANQPATHGQDFVYAPTALPAGGACIEMTTAYTPSGAKLWAWDWCGGRDTVGKVVNIDSTFISTYTTTINGRPAYTEDIHKTSTTANTWTAFLFNYRTQVWDTFFTSTGAFDIPQFTFGWNMFEIYSNIDPATGNGYYCADVNGKAFESTGAQVQQNGVWVPESPSLSRPTHSQIPPGSQYQCPSLKFAITHANDAWIATVGAVTTPPTSAPPSGTNLALTATRSTSFVSAWENLAAINDNFTPTSSADRAHPVYGNWPQQGLQWVQYDWTSAVSVNRVSVYWFDDNQGIDLPASCQVQYWNGSAFVNVPGASACGVAANTFNMVTFSTVSTTRIRLNVTSRSGFSTGILEVRALAP